MSAQHEPEKSRFRVDRCWRDHAVVLALSMLLLLPMLGSFGLWDPWETHYGEVGRQITERHDWISTWWGSHWQDAGGSQEGTFFYSKPILLMWMMAMGLEVFGVNELAIRFGVCLVAILGIQLVFAMGVSVFSRRAGWMMAAVLGTSPFWFFLSRQAQTDMPFVALMTVGLCFFMMGVFGRDREDRPGKLAYALTFGWLGITTIPQLTLLIAGLSRWRGAQNSVFAALTDNPNVSTTISGLLLGVFTAILAAAVWRGRSGEEAAVRARTKIAIAAFAVLWVPLLGLLVAALAVSSNLPRDLSGWFGWGGVQSALYASCLGLAVFLCIARPLMKKRRLYLLNFYVFVGLATLAKGLLGFMLPGAIIFFYIVLTRQWRILREVELGRGILVFIAVTFPWYAAMLIRHTQGFWNRFFVHDHFKRLASGVHQIDTGSFEHFLKWLGYGLFPWTAWIPAAIGRFFGGEGLAANDDRTRASLFLVVWAAFAFMLFTLSSTKFHHYIFPAVPALAMLVGLLLDDALDREIPQPAALFVLAVPFVALLGWDIVNDPKILKNLFTYKYDRGWADTSWDTDFRTALILAGIPALLGAVLLLFPNRRVRLGAFGGVVASGALIAIFSLQVYMPRLSESWSQKGLWDYYYDVCTPTEGPPGSDPRKTFCEQPVISFKLNWRGETYYSANEVIPIRDDDDFDHFIANIGDGTFYGIMEYARYRGEFQRRLPARFKNKSCVAYNRNEKFVLAKVPCADDDPERKEETPPAAR